MFGAGRRHGLGIGLSAAGVAVLAAACSGSGSAPRTLPPLSTTPAAVTSTAPTSKAADLAAVKAVVRRYYQLLNGLHIKMRPTELGALMTPACVCRAQVEAVRSAQRKQQHYVDTVLLVSLTAALESEDRADVLVQYNAGQGGLVDESGRAVTSTPPKKGIKRYFVLQKTNGQWLIDEIRAV